jgi:hypothetical protein
MANTYTLIESQVLGSSAASVTFSAIPATYTDLVLRVSARTDADDTSLITFNGTTTGYSITRLNGNGATATSTRSSSAVSISARGMNNATGTTANTFSNAEVYIPSYTVSQNKPLSSFGTPEDNATNVFMSVGASLWQNAAAITSINLAAQGGNYVTGSSFYLYGIKNS